MKRTQLLPLVIPAAAVFVLVLSIEARTVNAQSGHSQYASRDERDQMLVAQIKELPVKVIRLKAALAENQWGPATVVAGAPTIGMQMGAGGQPSGMGRMEGDHMGMGMQGQGGGMSSMTAGGGSPSGSGVMGGMDMMGKVSGSGRMPMPSALPGFPGASHLYHVGATGFFLDHLEHITLTMEQQTALSRIKEKVLLDQATTQRKNEGAEQELWTLSAADQPAADKVDAKVREIEKVRADQRLAFIRAVGEAAQVLTDEQRKVLLGQISPATPGTPQAATPGVPSGAPNAGAGMSDM
jgi:hypothetical protein